VVFEFGTIVVAVMCVPPVAADVVHQPLKVNPARVGVGSVPIAVPCGLIIDEFGVPPLALNVSVLLVAHLAQYVVFAFGTTVLALTCVPPVAADVVHQPLKVCPDLVGIAGKVPMVRPPCLCIVVVGAPP